MSTVLEQARRAFEAAGWTFKDRELDGSGMHDPANPYWRVYAQPSADPTWLSVAYHPKHGDEGRVYIYPASVPVQPTHVVPSADRTRVGYRVEWVREVRANSAEPKHAGRRGWANVVTQAAKLWESSAEARADAAERARSAADEYDANRGLEGQIPRYFPGFAVRYRHTHKRGLLLSPPYPTAEPWLIHEKTNRIIGELSPADGGSLTLRLDEQDYPIQIPTAYAVGIVAALAEALEGGGLAE